MNHRQCLEELNGEGRKKIRKKIILSNIVFNETVIYLMAFWTKVKVARKTFWWWQRNKENEEP